MRERRLDRLAAPPARPGFREELWERVEAAERAATRRWRRLSVALAVVAAFAVAGATALAATLVSSKSPSAIDKTLSCTTSLQGQRPVIWVQANLKSRLIPVSSVDVLTNPAANSVVAGQQTQQSQQLAVAAAKDGIGIDDVTCVPSTRRVPLARSGLHAAPTITTTFIGSLWQSCVLANRPRADRALLHVHVTLSGGIPTNAELAVRNEVTNAPVAYVVWTPTRVVSYFAATCKPVG